MHHTEAKGIFCKLNQSKYILSDQGFSFRDECKVHGQSAVCCTMPIQTIHGTVSHVFVGLPKRTCIESPKAQGASLLGNSSNMTQLVHLLPCDRHHKTFSEDHR